MNRQDVLKDELRRTYEKYVEGFKANDVKLIDEIVRYPIAYLKDGVVEMMDSYPIDPAKLKAAKGWDHSTDWHFDIPAINDHHAHAVASAVRRRVDGSVIERVHGFYAFTKIDGSWKMYAFSEVTS
ncbi:hypothetical protein [Agrobacterium tumefaciens]|jgi:hypothetical protein|uniref:Uncharacterized protein n=1 Tax=Agrobacterium tumefaciens TaxID=358 RepID=A0AA44JBR3_AGRTU|nr:hypothetical protein [Agrobacterium tumefaciens]NTB87860.1 hypothetical protein [Agrobacterium tumefaciens]NTC17048.1 hypothetical protein [Agrobacterium tumefaciens]NTC31107.1 hypothetical protein [Agrobacterium tumefaciens]